MNFQLYELYGLYELSTCNSHWIPARNSGAEPLLFVRTGAEPRCDQGQALINTRGDETRQAGDDIDGEGFVTDIPLSASGGVSLQRGNLFFSLGEETPGDSRVSIVNPLKLETYNLSLITYNLSLIT